MKKSRDMDLLFELGCLRFIERSWKRFLNPNFQNLTEHHFRVAWLALILAAREGVKDTGKVLKMALLHDIGESRTGDCDYLSRQYVKRDEDLAMSDILADTSLEEEFIQLWKEYSERTSIESKIVKDADNLDVDIELKEQETVGNTLPKKWQNGRNYVAKHKLYTKSAKKLLLELKKSDPHDWHNNGRTRFSSSGDWNKKSKQNIKKRQAL